MKCCESRTISTAESALRTGPARSSAPEAAVAFEALLFAQMLKPLSQSLGFYGDVALDACADSIARRRRFAVGANA